MTTKEAIIIIANAIIEQQEKGQLCPQTIEKLTKVSLGVF